MKLKMLRGSGIDEGKNYEKRFQSMQNAEIEMGIFLINFVN